MNFLAPLFLAGLGVVALPVLIHLIRRSVRERTIFSSLMFLQPSPPRLTRRSRLENLLLLALRCAAVCLLTLGFARPFLKHALPAGAVSGPARRMLVLVDTSASMRRAGLWAVARAQAEQLIRAAGPNDTLSLCAFDSRLTTLVSFEEWNARADGDRRALALDRLAALQPGWSGTALDAALTQAAERFGAGAGQGTARPTLEGPGQIFLITDLQEGSRINGLQGHPWPNGLEVTLQKVTPRAGNNAGIQLVADATDAPAAAEAAVRVRISNAPDSQRDQFQAGWAGTAMASLTNGAPVYVPAGQSRVITLPVPATNTALNRIVLRGDDEPFDNTLYVLPPETSQATVLYLGADSVDDTREPLFFLKRALLDTRRQAIRVTQASAAAPLDPAQSSAAGLIVVTRALDDAQAKALRAAIEGGSTVLLAPPTPAAAASLAGVFDIPRVSAEEATPDRYAMLAEIDFRHPLFASFADARFSDFTRIHFWRYRKLDVAEWPNAKVLARFDTGDPAILELGSGKGRAILLASGWHPADSQLALSSKFVPLLFSLLEMGAAAAPPPPQYFVGAAVSVPAGATVRLPGGTTAKLAPGETNFVAMEPGIYEIESARSAMKFAVNLEPAESRTAPLPADELDRLGVPGPRPTALARAGVEAQRKVRLQNTELESRQKLWRWFIVATLAVLAVETWLAGRTARRAAILKEDVV